MASEVMEITLEAQCQKVVELMFTGVTQKEACKEVGISVSTFSRFVTSSPIFTQQLQASIRSQFANFIDGITENSRKNLTSILQFSEELRDIIDNPLGDMEEKLKAFSALVKIEKTMEARMNQILPATKEAPVQGPPKLDDDAAAFLMTQLSGAHLVKVTRTTTVQLDSPEVVDVVARDVEE